MVAQAPDRRTGRLAGAAGIALLLAGLTLLLEPDSWRPAAAALLAVGLVVGLVAALRLPPSGRLRTPMERLNDAAFLVVISAVALIAVRLARPWTAALPGLVGGALLGLTLRPRAGRGPAPRPEPGSGRAEPPPPGARPPGGGA
jgi:membrane associated rhomboid family serine protease